MLAAHLGNILGLDAAEVSDVAAAVRFSIGVDDLTIEPGLGDAEAIIVGYHRRCVRHSACLRVRPLSG